MPDLVLPIDAFVRSIGINKSAHHAMFLGAGASITSGLPSAQRCIWEWKRSIFLTNNPGLEEQFSELSLDGVRRKIQRWIDAQAKFPAENNSDEYGFYIEQCFPISADRRAYFQEQVRGSIPHVGYRLLCLMADAGIIKSVWTTNFDGLVARAAAQFNLAPVEVGIDCQDRLPRLVKAGELLCVSLHGDYRYDFLKNTTSEVINQEQQLAQALEEHVQDRSLVIIGYSGRDESLMNMFKSAYKRSGKGVLYWCGFGDGEAPLPVRELLEGARENGRDAYYVPTGGFDDVMVRLAQHCLEGEGKRRATLEVSRITEAATLERSRFEVGNIPAVGLIKSNAFQITCPSEVFQLEPSSFPPTKVWAWLRDITSSHQVVAVPFKGKVLALGLLDEIKAVFKGNIKGSVERVPIDAGEFRFEDGAITSLMRQAVMQSLAHSAGLEHAGKGEMWEPVHYETTPLRDGGNKLHRSVWIHLKTLLGRQYLVLKPSLKVFSSQGAALDSDEEGLIRQRVLGYQHNSEFNQAVNGWRDRFFAGGDPVRHFDFPCGSGSTFRFSIRRSPVFSRIGKVGGNRAITIPPSVRQFVNQEGFELREPDLVFSNKDASGSARDGHPIRGILNNRPYDFALTTRGLAASVKVGVVCPKPESRQLASYLEKASVRHHPKSTEQDYLLPFPGFQSAFGVQLEIPRPGDREWVVLPEPVDGDDSSKSVELAKSINSSISNLAASVAPNVVVIYFPDRWINFRGYSDDKERFDVHDFVKAFCVQRGISTQFLNEDTLRDAQQCRVWWWLSLAIYVKSMRTPWLLDSLDQNTAFVGLGFSVDSTAPAGSHVTVGCSHIYSSRGEGLQYRLSKIEDPIFRGGNPYLSEDDARRLGETIRHQFFDSRLKLPDRVVLHKRTPFIKQERKGLSEGLEGVTQLEMLELSIDPALRYVASIPKPGGKFADDRFPVKRGTVVVLDDFRAAMWVHGAAAALQSGRRYYQGKRRIPAPLVVKRHVGHSDLRQIAEEIVGLSKMNWNTFDLYTKLPATVHSSGAIARIGSLLQRFGAESYDYRLFI